MRVERKVYLVLNKRTGVVTTASDPEGRPTVLDHVRVRERVFPVGRLDAATTGLLLLTNDGDLAERLMHPRYGITKTYHALVRGTVPPEVAEQLAAGIELDDGPTLPAVVRVVGRDAGGSVVEFVAQGGPEPPDPPDVRRRRPPGAGAAPHGVRAAAARHARRRSLAHPHADGAVSAATRRWPRGRQAPTLAEAGETGETAEREEGPMIKEFRDFLLRGNIIELAVAFVIGAAFALVVKSFNDNIITPIIAMLGGKPDFSGLYFTVNGAQFRWGAFLTDLLGFVITAAAVFFLVVKPVNTLERRRKRGEEPSVVDPPEDIVLLREIRDSLRAR